MKKQLRPKIRTDGRMAEKLIDYDEVGNIKKASEDEITTSYNMKNGVYQSDPYNFVISKNTQGLLVQYSYSSKNLLESVKTPDGKEVKYTRNALNEIADIDGWIKNCDYYSDKLIKNYETVSGIEVNRKYDTERNLTNLSYTQNSVILENYDYAYDNNFNLIRKNKNTYTYDSLNRLSTAFECDGKYEKPSDENEIKLYETIKDVAVNKDGEVLLTGQEEIVFDAGAKSIIADFGTEQLISKIKISPNYKVTRVYSDDVSLYIRSEDGDWRPITNCGKKKNEKDGSITIILNKHEMGRYVKVHNLYDERTYENEIDNSRSNFKNTPEKIIQITTVGSVLDESYAYDSISNRSEYVRNHKRYKLEYYKNTAGGNSSLVKNDGVYEYKYDKNGNRISKEGNGEVWKYTWDLHNRLIKVEMESNGNKMVEVSYRYDHENNKLRRESDGNTVEYMYDFEGKLLYESEDTRKRSYVYMGSRLIGFTEGAKQYHIVTDETGSVRKIYEGDSEVWCGTYSPYGKLMSHEGELEISALFAGKEIDADTGLTYHWNRWRNEEGDAFISEDPVRDGYNWYGYANANPFRYADSNGLESYVCRDGTFCSEGDISNASYRADCYYYNGYNSGTIASMSTTAYSLYNNGGQATLALSWKSVSSPSAAEEIKNCGNVDVENVIRGKIANAVVLLENKDEVNERITELVVYMPVICDDGRIHEAALYGQHAWVTAEFELGFDQSACCATDLLNIASIVYTQETGNTLTFENAIRTMMSAVGKEFGIRSIDAFVEDYQTVANYMTDYLGLSVGLSYNEGKGTIKILPLAKKYYEDGEFAGFNTNDAGHFILCLDSILGLPKNSNYCYDPDTNQFTFWASDGYCGVRTGDNYITLNGFSICRPLQTTRDYRAFDILR